MNVNGHNIDTTLPAALRSIAEAAPGKDCLVFTEYGRHITFSQLVGTAERYAAGLLLMTGGKPFTAIICTDISPEWYFFFWGILFAGGKAVSLSARCTAEILSSAAKEVSADIIILSADLKELSESIDSSAAIICDSEDFPGITQETAAGLPGTRSTSPCVIQFTSGTSAKPKCAVLSHRGILYVAYNMLRNMNFTSDERYLMISPVFHIAGILGMLFGLLSGSTSYPIRCFTGKRAVECVTENDITAVTAVPTMYAEMVRRVKSRNVTITTLKKGGIAGSSIPDTLIRDIYGYLGLTGICTCYGLTEFSPIAVMTMHDDPIEVKMNSAGAPFEGTDIKLVSLADGTEIDTPGTEGEIYLRGPGHMLGYLNTDVTVGDNDFFATGDVGMLLPDGRLRITGRAGEMIIKGGENIAPAEIERVLLMLDGISECAVVSIPDSELDEEILAAVSPNTDAPCSESIIIGHLKKYLEPYKLPKYILFCDSLPKNANGKIDKRKIREDFLSSN